MFTFIIIYRFSRGLKRTSRAGLFITLFHDNRENICIEEKFILWSTLGPDHYRLMRHEPAIQSKTSAWSAVNFKKHKTSMSSKPEPTIWSHDTGQRIPCFDRCQLTIAWIRRERSTRQISLTRWSKPLWRHGERSAQMHKIFENGVVASGLNNFSKWISPTIPASGGVVFES